MKSFCLRIDQFGFILSLECNTIRVSSEIIKDNIILSFQTILFEMIKWHKSLIVMPLEDTLIVSHSKDRIKPN